MLRRLATLLMLVIPAALATAGTASAQRSFDDERYRGNTGESDRSDRSDRTGGRERNVAGEFDYYALVMSWSPTYCSEKDGDGADLQCNRQDGRRYSFVLHGLWPQYERGYPGQCFTRRKPFVPQPVIDGMLDIMPSPKLVIHEYRKHGTCSGLEPAGYYDLARRLFKKINVPDRFQNPYEALFVSPEDLEDGFIDANPGLKPESVAISCGGAGNRLKEVRICFTKDGELRACGANEEQRKLCNAQKMYVPPVRSSKIGPDSAADREKANRAATPRPRLIEGVTGR